MSDRFVINGELWRVLRVKAGDPRLVDRVGVRRLATADPLTRVICIRDDLTPPLLDKVLMHEVAHAVTMSWDMLTRIRSSIPQESWVAVEEWAAQLVENHAIEVVNIASNVLGRPVCVRGKCLGESGDHRA